MNFSAHQVILAVLWAAPVIQILAAAGFLAFSWHFRRVFGAQTMPVGAFALAAVIVLLLHAGYFLAPLWWSTGRQLLGAATMLPVALAVLGLLGVTLTQTDFGTALMRAEMPRRVAAVACAGALVLAYVGPLVLMLAASA